MKACYIASLSIKCTLIFHFIPQSEYTPISIIQVTICKDFIDNFIKYFSAFRTLGTVNDRKVYYTHTLPQDHVNTNLSRISIFLLTKFNFFFRISSNIRKIFFEQK